MGFAPSHRRTTGGSGKPHGQPPYRCPDRTGRSRARRRTGRSESPRCPWRSGAPWRTGSSWSSHRLWVEGRGRAHPDGRGRSAATGRPRPEPELDRSLWRCALDRHRRGGEIHFPGPTAKTNPFLRGKGIADRRPQSGTDPLRRRRRWSESDPSQPLCAAEPRRPRSQAGLRLRRGGGRLHQRHGGNHLHQRRRGILLRQRTGGNASLRPWGVGRRLFWRGGNG